MLTSDVLAHFGTQAAAARALGIGRAAVNKWGDLVPPLQAIRLCRITHGVLQFDVEKYAGWRKPKLFHSRPG